MEANVPRVIIAGTGSGCGKTTVTCAVLQALKNRHLNCGAFKCGPDFIDPMFHRAICGDSGNLDAFLFSDEIIHYLLAKYGEGKDVSIIEGVMGYYDGLGIDSTAASTYDLARITKTPVILLVNGKGAALSVLAMIRGFTDFLPENQIRGVIINNCSPSTYNILSEAIRNHFSDNIIPLGFMPPMPNLTLKSRHLGLITPESQHNLPEIFSELGRIAEDTIDLDGILDLSRSAPSVRYQPPEIKSFSVPVRIGIAYDEAFCFYYRENLDLLKALGAELIPFSPLTEKSVPDNIDGLYIGGGYPEVYLDALSENVSMRNFMKNCLQKKIPCIAECGGFMYLTEKIENADMTGFLPGICHNNNKLTRFGYITLRAKHANLLCDAGETIRGHEFHYWDCSEPGSDFTAEKPSGRHWDCAIGTESLYAGFPHFNFYSNLKFAERFYSACLRYKERK